MTSTLPRVLPDVDAVRRACRPGGVRAVVQPLVRLVDGETVGYEALGRVVDDAGVGPADWLVLASEHGLQIELELAFLRAAGEIGPTPGNVALFVNASAATLLDPRVELVRHALPRHVLELSERDRIEDYAQLLPRLRAWRAQGTQLAIDDAGAGYANMAHVLQLDPAFVKIDRFIISASTATRGAVRWSLRCTHWPVRPAPRRSPRAWSDSRSSTCSASSVSTWPRATCWPGRVRRGRP